MAVEYICDGCGKRVKMASSNKPHDWFERTDKETRMEYHACSRKCIDKIREETGMTGVVLPF